MVPRIVGPTIRSVVLVSTSVSITDPVTRMDSVIRMDSVTRRRGLQDPQGDSFSDSLLDPPLDYL